MGIGINRKKKKKSKTPNSIVMWKIGKSLKLWGERVQQIWQCFEAVRYNNGLKIFKDLSSIFLSLIFTLYQDYDGSKKQNIILNKYNCSGSAALNVKDTKYIGQSNQKLFHHYQHVNIIQSTWSIHQILFVMHLILEFQDPNCLTHFWLCP